MPSIIAHRGFAGREPEMTRAAYEAAIAWCAQTGIPLGLECDVQLSADLEVVCLHDLTLERTAGRPEAVADLTLAQLRDVDFGSWRLSRPTPAQSALVSLAELIELVRTARADGVPVSLVVETKHPSPHGPALDEAVAALLAEVGWTDADAPVQLLSFDPASLQRLGRLVPRLRRTLLIELDLGRWRSGRLPDGIRVAGPDVELIRADPDFVRRCRDHGTEVAVWTVNDPADVSLCADLGVVSVTTDVPDRVAAALAG